MPVTKSIQRQTLTAITIGGNYTGGQAGAYSGSSCSLGAYTDSFGLQVTQPGDGSVTFSFNYASGINCTMSGTLQQKGQLYNIPNVHYQCTDSSGGMLDTNATMSEVKATSLGIEGILAAPSVGSGCREDAQFSAVLL